jgi:hypothetical protein
MEYDPAGDDGLTGFQLNYRADRLNRTAEALAWLTRKAASALVRTAWARATPSNVPKSVFTMKPEMFSPMVESPWTGAANVAPCDELAAAALSAAARQMDLSSTS